MAVIFVPAWSDTTSGKAVEHAVVTQVERMSEASSRACMTISDSQYPQPVPRPKYAVTWRSENPPAGRAATFVGYSCDQYAQGDERNVIRGGRHHVTVVNWLNVSIYRVVLLCVLSGVVAAAAVYIALPRGRPTTGPVL